MDELEHSLRDTLRDERWALTAWPDPERRLRASARTRRRRRAGVVVVGVVVVVAALVVPLASGRSGGHGRARLTAGSPSPKGLPTATRQVLPQPGGQFPLAVYPAPVRPATGAGGGVIQECPDPTGLQPVGAVSRSTVIAELTLLARGTSTPLDAELLGLDRTEWPQFAAERPIAGPAGTINLLYTGPLLAKGASDFGPPDFADNITQACGALTAERSFVAVEGPANSPALQGVFVFVRRGGRLLVYFDY